MTAFLQSRDLLEAKSKAVCLAHMVISEKEQAVVVGSTPDERTTNNATECSGFGPILSFDFQMKNQFSNSRFKSDMTSLQQQINNQHQQQQQQMEDQHQQQQQQQQNLMQAVSMGHVRNNICRKCALILISSEHFDPK